MQDKYRSAVFIGPPGVGKTAQSTKLATENDGYFHFSMGHALRMAQIHNPEIGAILSAGNLVPGHISLWIMKEALKANEDSGDYFPSQELLLLDGVPRTVGQAEALVNDFEIESVIYIVAPDEVILERLTSRGRYDDTVEIIERRLTNYRQRTLPVIDLFEQHQVYLIDGNNEIEKIHEEIVKYLK